MLVRPSWHPAPDEHSALHEGEETEQGDRVTGYLWRKVGHQEDTGHNQALTGWQRVWAVLQESTLIFYREKQATKPAEAWSVAGAGVFELMLKENWSTGRYTKGLFVKFATEVLPEEAIEALSPGSDASAASTGRASSTPGSLPREEELYLAASEGTQDAWQAHLRRAAMGFGASGDGAGLDQEERLLSASNGSCSGQPSLLAPSLEVVAQLCKAGQLSGRELLQILRATRLVFSDGLMNLGSVREEASNAQRALFRLRSQLMDMERVLLSGALEPSSVVLADAAENGSTGSENGTEIASSCSEATAAGEGGGGVVKSTREWLRRAQAFTRELDAGVEEIMGKDSPISPDWTLFVHRSTIRLRDIEEALHAGQIAERRLRRGLENGGCLHTVRNWSTPKSRLPYNTHWKGKVAI